jgi:hypothetical protein
VIGIVVDATKPFPDSAITAALLDSRREIGKGPAAIARCDVVHDGR